jgi:Zn-dependent M28 family amino/carboxypeptidase
VLLISFVLVIDITLSNVVPGAYDNASGVAAVLSAAEELDENPPANLDVWVVLPGAEECNAEGMAAWFRRHRKDLDREQTFFVNLDSLSYGTVHYLDGEGAIVTYAMDPRLRQLAAAVAESGIPAAEGSRPLTIPFHTDALPAVARGFRAISLIGAEDGVGAPYYHTHEDTPDKIDDEALTRAVSFTVELVRALDRDLGRAAPAATTASAEREPAAHQV